MENYQRRKLYRVHLKNISQIKNCRNPKSPIAYPSRLYNADLGINSLQTARNTAKQRFSNKKKMMNTKRLQQNYLKNYQIEKQNFRLSSKLLNANGSINMMKYQRQYQEHRKIMNLHRKVKQKRVILYKIHDIKFKGLTPDLEEIFTIYDISKTYLKQSKLKDCKPKSRLTDKLSKSHYKQNQLEQQMQQEQENQKFISQNNNLKIVHYKRINTPSLQPSKHNNSNNFLSTKVSMHKPQFLLLGNIFQLRKSMIKGHKDQRIKLKICGRVTGQIILEEKQMIPIMHNKQIIGSVIVEIC